MVRSIRKGPPPRTGDGPFPRSKSDHGDRRGLRALLALADLELDASVLFQALEAVTLDLAVVNEDVAATVVGGDEAEPLLGVEPLHSALSHKKISMCNTKKQKPLRRPGSTRGRFASSARRHYAR